MIRQFHPVWTRGDIRARLFLSGSMKGTGTSSVGLVSRLHANRCLSRFFVPVFPSVFPFLRLTPFLRRKNSACASNQAPSPQDSPLAPFTLPAIPSPRQRPCAKHRRSALTVPVCLRSHLY